MSRHLRLVLVLMAGACTGILPPSPQRLAACTDLFNTWARYAQHWVLHHTGQRARAELALHRCQQGRYDEGIPELKEILRRNGFTLKD